MSLTTSQVKGTKKSCTSGQVRFAFTLEEKDFELLISHAVKNGRTVAGEIRIRVRNSLRRDP
jgi:hypothetical protein